MELSSKKQWDKKNPWMSHFSDARVRCVNKNNKAYKYYGGRGIKFLTTKEDFKVLWFRDKAHEMKRPSIDRKNNDGNYELLNCRFIEQSENSRKDILGEKNPLVKLTVEKVKQIRELFNQGITQVALGKRFGVDNSTVSQVVRCKTWKE